MESIPNTAGKPLVMNEGNIEFLRFNTNRGTNLGLGIDINNTPSLSRLSIEVQLHIINLKYYQL